MSTKNFRNSRTRKRRNDSDDYDQSDDNFEDRKRINFSNNLYNTYTTHRKGRDLVRTRSRPNNTLTEVISRDISNGELEEYVDDEDTIIYSQRLMNNVKSNKYSEERIKIGRNLLRQKYKTELDLKEFGEKMSKVFKDVYMHYFNSCNNTKSTVNLEKECQNLTIYIAEIMKQSRSQFTEQFAKLLYENISNNVKSVKDLIINKLPNLQVKAKYLELKKIINSVAKEETNKNQFEAKYIIEVMNFCKENKVEIVNIVNDLNRVYKILIKLSPFLTEILKQPITDLETDFNVKLNLENIHREEFLNVIINDDFIKLLIIEVKEKDLESFIKLRPIISNIEDEIKRSEKDMKKLKDILEEFGQTSIDLNDVQSLNQFLIESSKKNNRGEHCLNINCKHANNIIKENNGKVAADKIDQDSIKSNEISINAVNTGYAANICKVKLKNNENAHKNIDELYEYIIADDNKQSKKHSKKNTNGKLHTNTNKKKIIKNNSNYNTNVPDKSSTNININFSSTPNSMPINFNIEFDKEIEEFANIIKSETIHAQHVRKVKPKISFEWIQHITKI